MPNELFFEFYLLEALGQRLQKAQEAVNGLEEDYLLNASESDLTAHLVSRYEADPPKLGDPVIAGSREADIDVRGDMRYMAGADFLGDDRRFFAKGTRLEIHVPYTGDGSLFRCAPTTQIMPRPRAEIRKDHLAFIYATPGEIDAGQTKQSFERTITAIRTMLESLSADCTKWNGELENQIRQMIAGRKSRLLKNREAVAGIGLPMKRREDTAKTYSVPTVRRKPQIQMPVVKVKTFAPEPALAQEEYEYILSVVKSWAISVERSPDAFRHMGEEDLRWQILVMLNSHYEGRATGETFNRQGKTDILIREGDRNVFIAECALWKGEAYLTEKIDQILGYLHWRDTKAAVIVFNRNKSFSEVLEKVEPTVTKHACCKKPLKKVSETERRFLFCNKDDRNRELQLAVPFFDVPQPNA